MIINGTVGNDILTGGSENDILSGLKGNDYLDGKGGADTYLFTQGDGQDTVEDYSSDTSVDTLVFSGAALTTANVVVTRLGDSTNLKISFKGLSDSVVLGSQIFSGLSNGYGVENVKFNDGIVWTKAQLWSAYLTAGASSNDTLTGTSGNDTLRGGWGRDYLEGKDGADTYLFQLGDGQDTIYEYDSSIDRLVFSGTGLTAANALVTCVSENGDLKISFKGLSDTVTLAGQAGKYAGQYGIDGVTFSDGVVWNREQLLGAYMAAGANTNDAIYGTNANNTIRGGRGQDYLDGRLGSDTYLFHLGDGQDTITDFAGIADNPGFDQLVFSGAGLTAANAVITRIQFPSYNYLKISFKGLSDSVVLADIMPYSPKFSADGTALIASASNSLVTDGIETVTFSDGTVWTKAQLWNASTAQTNTTLNGTSGNDTLTGGTGDDKLFGLAGNDTLRGGRGDDELRGGEGADSYLFQLGDGADTIYADGDMDTLIFSGTGLTSTNAIVTRLWNSRDLQITFGGLSDSVALRDQVYSSNGGYGVKSVRFSNGVTWTKEQLWNAYLNQGAASDDMLLGTEANNTIRGGLGNDFLDGGQGADTYLFKAGDGGDTIRDNGYDSGIDKLVLSGTGLTSSNVRASRVGDSSDVQLSFGGTSNSILLQGQLSRGNYGLESIQFSNGGTWNKSQLLNALV